LHFSIRIKINSASACWRLTPLVFGGFEVITGILSAYRAQKQSLCKTSMFSLGLLVPALLT
jgi:hypothetical protein